MLTWWEKEGLSSPCSNWNGFARRCNCKACRERRKRVREDAARNEELIDLIADAIDDSLDMDWVSTDGAKSVLRALEREGYVIVEKKND